MSSLEAVVYVSSAVGPPSEEELAQLLDRSRAKNQEVGVTGALLYHDGTFFQYFEGPTAAVDLVYERIRQSPLHRGIVELMRAPIAERAFSDWSMGFTHAPQSTILQLSHAAWASVVSEARDPAHISDGMALLNQFWQTSHPSRLRLQ